MVSFPHRNPAFFIEDAFGKASGAASTFPDGHFSANPPADRSRKITLYAS